MHLIVPSHACDRPLIGWKFDPRYIGKHEFTSGSEFLEVVDKTYQQKAHTSGYISGVSGFSYDGYGVTGGGGGQIWTSHENVISCVVQDRNGRESQMEFPSRLAVRETAIIRLDTINRTIIAVRNISGQGDPIMLSDEDDFFPQPNFSKGYVVLALIGLVVLDEADWDLTWMAAGLALLVPLLLYIYRKVEARRKRAEIRALMNRVVSTENPSLAEVVDAGWKPLEISEAS